MHALLFYMAAAAAAGIPEPTPQMLPAEAPRAIARLAPAEAPAGKVLRAVEAHLRDDLPCLPPPALVFERPLPAGTSRVRGSVEYLKWVRGHYDYRIDTDADGRTTVSVPIHFLNASGGPLAPQEFDEIAAGLARASDVWTESAPAPLKGRLRFRFWAAAHRREAPYAVRLTRESVRALYYYRWSLGLSPEAIAHEVGHMMGLNDEYEILTIDSRRCPAGSLMCESSTGKPYPYHYYLVLRRAFCPSR